MKIDEINEVEEYLRQTKEFFSCIDTERERIERELKNKEYERDDWLHEIELASLNAIERSRVYGKLEKVLKERRELKDKLDLINTLRGFTSKFIVKGICAEVNQVIENVNTLKKNKINRVYNPRILKDLKCAKKEKIE